MEKTPAQILREASAYIEANGLLFDNWDSGDGTEDLPPCCCVAGTLRRVAGLPATPPPGTSDAFDSPDGVLEACHVAVRDQTRPERRVLGEKRFDIPTATINVFEWSDHYADTELVRSTRGRDYEIVEFRRLEHADGDRGHVARVLRQAAGRCES